MKIMLKPSKTASAMSHSLAGLHESQEEFEKSNLYFCDTCLIVQSAPAKHCKLCEHCCTKFDHHCLFIRKCVGLKNHREFIYFLICSISCIFFFVYGVACFLIQVNNELYLSNANRAADEQITILYFLFSSTPHIWLLVQTGINVFTVFGVTFLLLFQLKFISLGFTSQFMPPGNFVVMSKKMRTTLSALKHRFDNLVVFFSGSYEQNEALYFKQLNEHRNLMIGNVNNNSDFNNQNTMSYYPRDNFHNFNHVNSENVPMISQNIINDSSSTYPKQNFQISINNLGGGNTSSSSSSGQILKAVEIELD
jgi:hypothetical protein